jgi:hypothetical protein
VFGSFEVGVGLNFTKFILSVTIKNNESLKKTPNPKKGSICHAIQG